MRRSRLRQRSVKKARRDREYAKVHALVLERDEHCRFDHLAALRLGHTVPCERGFAVHHIVLRSQSVKQQTDFDNLILICGASHDFLHANPAIAKELGLYGE